MRRPCDTGHDSETFICDSHLDTLSKMLKFGWKRFSEIPSDSHVTPSRLRKSKVGVAVFALFTEKRDPSFPPLQRTLKMIDMAQAMASEHSDWMEPVGDYKGITKARRSGRLAVILSIENGIAIGDDLALLRTFHRLGVRFMGLTWNHRNRLGDGAGKFRGRRGLTQLGRDTIREMERLGMIVDVSHLNERTFWQVVEFAERPVVATHSNAFSVCPSPRNLKDLQIRAISEQGGFIGLNFCEGFLNDSGEATAADVIRHAIHIAEVGGIQVLAIGSDFDGIETTPRGLEHIGKVPKLIPLFRKAGFSQADIACVTNKNFLRVFRQACDKKASPH